MEAAYRYWGKASRQSPEAGHLLVYHCLDVAAVADALLQAHPRVLGLMSHRLGVDDAHAAALFRFLAALHDIGKFSDAFQGLAQDLSRSLGHRVRRTLEDFRHDSLGALAWREVVWPTLWQRGDLCANDGTDEYSWRDDALGPLAAAAMGHHGEPCQRTTKAGTVPRWEDYFTGENATALREYAAELRSVWPDQAQPLLAWTDELPTVAKDTSWLLAGLVVLADWIGSNEQFFAWRRDTMPLRDYWVERALPQAAAAIQACGMLPCEPSGRDGMGSLFPTITNPSPLQRLVEWTTLADGPQLFVIEDLTGAGKTEAALVLAQRLINRGAADGLYMGLPTMATANAMFERVSAIHGKLYAQTAHPSLVLAHSARELSDLFRKLSGPRAAIEPTDLAESGGDTGRAWVADNRKKALLASVGVGTVDQALLAGLPVRHQSLRLLGLCRKVLLVDEVHACDAYMHRLLCALLRFHAGMGGSAILLSATLPLKMRRELAESFQEGARRETPVLRDAPYPLLTCVGAEGASETEFNPPAGLPRRVQVRFVAEMDEIVKHLGDAAAMGHCACWIRNTVDDAIQGIRLLRATGVGQVTLFHARFALGDRLGIEQEVKARFGKASGHAARTGQVLVATQVVEQSLDLDFDVMVSDLAPVDRLVQRAGRLCRHARNVLGDRVDGPDTRGEPLLWVFAPAFVDDPGADWFKAFLPGAAAVYPNHGELWLTVRLLTERGGFRLPDDARPLIEGVFGPREAAQIPKGLMRAEEASQAKRMAQTAIAAQDTLKPDLGYDDQPGAWIDERRVATRLDAESVTLRLARRLPSGFAPWSDAQENAWALSDVSVRCARVRSVCLSPADEEAVQEVTARMPDGGRWSLVVPLRAAPGGDGSAEVQDARGRRVALRYDATWGLTFEQSNDGG